MLRIGIFFLAVLVFSGALTKLSINYITRWGVVDTPNKPRKIHKAPLPLLGGIPIFLSFFVALFFLREQLVVGDLEFHHWLSFFIGGLILMIGGYLDDKFDLKPGKQIIFPILAAITVILGGVSIEKITNPLGGFIFFDTWQIALPAWWPIEGGLSLLSALVIFLWLMGMMQTTKLLDGIDGLVTGVTAIGAFIIFLFTMTTKYFQPDIGMAAIVLCASALGFLAFNWHPAKIFLGEGGSLFLGFSLGVLAIISGGKIAIALLIMGIPILDVAWTIIRRARAGKNPFRFADRQHLHYRILDLGLSQRQTALIYYLMASAFGLTALFLQSLGKVMALIILLIIMLTIIIGFNKLEKKKKNV